MKKNSPEDTASGTRSAKLSPTEASHERERLLGELGAVAVLVLAMTGSAGGAECQFRMGPYTSQSMAELGVQQARNVGLNTSSVWGEAGGASRPANGKYFFNVVLRAAENIPLAAREIDRRRDIRGKR